jgi:hypothetical protein
VGFENSVALPDSPDLQRYRVNEPHAIDPVEAANNTPEVGRELALERLAAGGPTVRQVTRVITRTAQK